MWEEVFKPLGITAIIATAATYAIQKVIDRLAASSLERYKHTLASELEAHKASLNRETEGFKAELNKVHIQYQIKFSKLHEDRAVIIREIYLKIYNLETALKHLTSIAQGPEWSEDKEREDKAFEIHYDIKDYFEKNQIYFEDSVCLKLDKAIKDSLEIIQEMRRAKRMDKSRKDAYIFGGKIPNVDPTDTWDALFERTKTEFYQSRMDLAQEFKRLMGIEIE
jgi:hypothetical protein